MSTVEPQNQILLREEIHERKPRGPCSPIHGHYKIMGWKSELGG
jgi:hypothetical protein